MTWMKLVAGLLVIVFQGISAANVNFDRGQTALNDQAAKTAQAVASSPSKSPVKVDRRDPEIDKVIPAGAMLERVATGFTWVEGPVWIPAGHLMFAEITSNSIRRVSASGTPSIFLQPSGYKGTKPFGGKEPGTNGMTLDRSGRLTVAGHAQRDIFRLESLNATAQITILADSYRGKKLNSPNDLVYRRDGSLYFTDPPYGLPTQSDKDPAKELQVNGVYRIPKAFNQQAGNPPARDQLQLLVGDLTRPNGIAFSPDQKYLYVDNSEPKKLWMRYRVKEDGSLTDAKVFYDATSDTRRGSPDGMKVDQEGRIYSAGPGGVWIFSPEGKPLGVILTPESVSNVAWGGAEHKTLYVTATSSIYRIELKVAGSR
jgi:gluconolactonase